MIDQSPTDKSSELASVPTPPPEIHQSLLGLSAFAGPAKLLIQKVSDAITGLAKPWQTRRVAKAEADAAITHATAEIKITDLHRRAGRRFIEEEAKKQANIESIVEQALPQLEAGANPAGMEDDWITNFFDKSRIISGADMQRVWAAVLAREANAPGSFSRKTVNLLGDLDKQDAELFMTLCRFCWDLGDPPRTPLIFDWKAPIYKEHGITFDAVSHLTSLGLVQFTGVGSYQRDGLPRHVTCSYFERILGLTLRGDDQSPNHVTIGKVLLTNAGAELTSICSSIEPVPNFFDFVVKKWTEEHYDPKVLTDAGARVFGKIPAAPSPPQPPSASPPSADSPPPTP